MFDNQTNPQFAADTFKGIIAPIQSPAKAYVLDLIAKFERCDWHPMPLHTALSNAHFAPDLTYSGDNVLAAVRMVLESYLQEMCPQSLNAFSTEQAAHYLELAVRTVKHHIHETKKLKGTLVGKTLVFTRAELDAFAATERKAGRPSKQKA